MNLKISPYYYKHLLKHLAPTNKQEVRAPKLANFIGLSIKNSDFNQLAITCCEVEKDPLFVIRTAAKSLPAGHGVLGLLVQSCNTLGEACASGYKFQHLTRNALHSTLSYQQGTVTSSLDIENYDPESVALLVEYCQASIYEIANYLFECSKPIKIQEIHFMHKALGPVSEYKKILETDSVLFSQAENKIVFAREVMDYTIERADSGARQALLQEAQIQLQTLIGSESFTTKLSRLLLDQRTFRPLILADCAMALNVSESTFKRRLLEEGTSYQTIFDAVRDEQASYYLEKTLMPIQKISEALGYSNRSAFARAFRRRIGSSPLQYRQSHLAMN
jgi:AraC-like DNA-binding protein